MSEFVYVSNEKELSEASKELSKESILGVDLECENGLHKYGTFITLIQISSRTKDYIIDAYLIKDMKSLLNVLSNPDIIKIFHNVTFDFRILNYEYNVVPKNVFDTQLASEFLGEENFGLGNLLQKYFDIDKEKKFQMADWTKRPISNNMLNYAVKDSHYLIELREKLIDELKNKNIVDWVSEEMKHLEEVDWTLEKQHYYDLRGYRLLNDTQRAIIKRLYEYREIIAERVNRPPHFVMNTKTLFHISQNPLTLKEWKNLSRVHPIVRKKAESFFREQEKGKEEKIVLEIKKREKFTKEQRQLFEELHEKRDLASKKYNIAPYLIANKEQIKRYSLGESSFRDWQKNILELD